MLNRVLPSTAREHFITSALEGRGANVAIVKMIINILIFLIDCVNFNNIIFGL